MNKAIQRPSVRKRILKFNLTLLPVLAALFLLAAPAPGQDNCPPTRPDAEGPFYKPGVPLRDSTGSGLVIRGVVRTTGSCQPIPGARVEWWQTAPDGRYADSHRGALLSDSAGGYTITTDPPPPYSGRPSHVHIKVFAAGHHTLTTQVYPAPGQATVQFDFVLVPQP